MPAAEVNAPPFFEYFTLLPDTVIATAVFIAETVMMLEVILRPRRAPVISTKLKAAGVESVTPVVAVKISETPPMVRLTLLAAFAELEVRARIRT